MDNLDSLPSELLSVSKRPPSSFHSLVRLQLLTRRLSTFLEVRLFSQLPNSARSFIRYGLPLDGAALARNFETEGQGEWNNLD
jgi:hypothetical protein